jgi:hypothetical protein
VASDKAAKIAKMSDSWTPQHSDHKENVDPQHNGSDADQDTSCSKTSQTSQHRNTAQVSAGFHVLPSFSDHWPSFAGLYQVNPSAPGLYFKFLHTLYLKCE